MSERKLLTAKDVAAILSCSPKTVYDLAGSEQLPCVRISGRGDGSRPMVRIWSDDLDRYLAKCVTGGPDPYGADFPLKTSKRQRGERGEE